MFEHFVGQHLSREKQTATVCSEEVLLEFEIFKELSRQSTRLFLQSSELGPPLPHPQASVSLFGSGGKLARGRGGGSPNSGEGTDTVVL
jgi:hypothetical protein